MNELRLEKSKVLPVANLHESCSVFFFLWQLLDIFAMVTTSVFARPAQVNFTRLRKLCSFHEALPGCWFEAFRKIKVKWKVVFPKKSWAKSECVCTSRKTLLSALGPWVLFSGLGVFLRLGLAMSPHTRLIHSRPDARRSSSSRLPQPDEILEAAGGLQALIFRQTRVFFRKWDFS